MIKKNYYCEKHFNKYIKYCFTDHKNICEQCEKEHEGHNIANYESMTPDVEELKASLNKMEENITDLKLVINDIKNFLDDALRMFKRYHYIAKDIIGKYELFNKDLKNNRILKSLWNLQFSNTKINDELNKILDEENLIKKTEKLVYISENNEEIYKKNSNIIIDFKKEDDEWWKEIEKIITKNGKKNN